MAQAPVITPKPGPIKLALNANGILTVPLNSLATVTPGGGNSLSVEINPATLNCSMLGPFNISVKATNVLYTPANAKFNEPRGVTTDAGGNIFVADYANSRVRIINTASGTVGTYAGSTPGYADGDQATSKFMAAFKLTADQSGNVYVMDGIKDANGYGDVYNPRLRKIGTDGQVTTLAGGTAGLKDGKNTDARFLTVGGVVAANSGNLYVSDAGNLRKISPTGQVSTLLQIGGYTSVDSAKLSLLGELGVDAADNIYVSDIMNNYIWKYSYDGKLSIFASGDKLGFTVSAELTADRLGNVYSSSGGTIRKITAKGEVILLTNNAPFGALGLSCDASGNIYVADSGNKIWKVSPEGVVTLIAGDVSGFADGNIGGTTKGSSSTATIPVTVISTPVITTVFKDVNIFANSLGKAILPDYASTTKTSDNCGASIVTVTQSPAAGTAIDVNTTITVTITATDTGGGKSSVTFQVTAVDASAPVITPNKSPIVLYLDGTGHKTVQVPDIATVTSTINPNPYSTVSPATLDCSTVGTQTLTVTANDGMTNPIPQKLNTPYNVATDAQENLYVTDPGNHVIRKITPAGYVTVFAGSGAAGNLDGTGTSANFDTPTGIAIDKNGNLYVADQKNNNIRKISPAGVVSTYAGLGTAGAVNGAAATATFNGPLGITVANDGTVYIADAGNNRIRKIGTDGMVSTVAGEGSAGEEDGLAAAASFYNPHGIAIDAANVIYVADGNNKIRTINNGNVTTIAGGKFPGAVDGTGTVASFNDLYNIVFYNGQVYAADRGNNAIRIIDVLGKTTTYVGSTSASTLKYVLNEPTGVTAGPSGSIYIVNAADGQILKINPTGVIQPLSLTFAPNNTGNTSGNQSQRTITVQVMSTPIITTVLNDVTIAANENCVALVPDYTKNVAYTDNCTVPVTLTQVPAAGTVLGVNSTTKVTITATDANGGTQSKSFSLNVIEKGPIITPLAGPFNFKLDANGTKTIQWTDLATVFSCVSPSPAVKLSPATFDCSTMGKQNVIISATSNGNFTPSQPANASFYYPLGITTDASGNFYITDSYNHRIRKMSPSGEVTTIAGSGMQGNADGIGTQATFFTPVAIVIDAGGNLFVADQNAGLIRKITPQSVVSTFANLSSPLGLAIDASGNLYVAGGTGLISKVSPKGVVTTIAGGGAVPPFKQPSGIAIDAAGNLFISDMGNNRIRKLATDGTITTIAGSGSAGLADGTGTAAKFYSPNGIAIDPQGNLFVADQNNNAIRQITPAGVVTTLAGSGMIGHSDGTGDKAQFYFPYSLVFGRSGDLFVADSYNSLIRAINPSGVVRTVAGTGLGEYADGNVGTDLLDASSTKTVEVNILNNISITSSTADVTVSAYNSCPAVVPDLTKIATANSFCSAIPVTFTQSPAAGTPLTVGVPVKVTLTATDRTGATATAQINVTASLKPDPKITISAPVTAVCAGSSITFTAVPQNADASATYQWLVNGNAKGTSNPVFTSSTLADGDRVTCQLVVNSGCSISSNTIQITVDALPTVTLATDVSIDNGDVATLNPVITGKVTRYTWSPTTGLDNPNIANPKASPLITTKYTLTVATTTGCTATGSITVNLRTPLVVPNSFSPNGDGINDLWTIKNIINYPNCEVDVFNRTGKRLFHSVGYSTAWDGRFNGASLPWGTYYYIIRLPKQNQTLSGNISIIK